MNEITISGTQNFMGVKIPIIEGGFGDSKKSITDKSISEIHNTQNYKIRERINDNIKRFKEGIDYIDLKGILDTDTLINLGYSKQSITQAKHIYLLSERGYTKLIKIMDSDLAWEIYDKLVDDYFSMREIVNSKEKLLAETDRKSTRLNSSHL